MFSFVCYWLVYGSPAPPPTPGANRAHGFNVEEEEEGAEAVAHHAHLGQPPNHVHLPLLSVRASCRPLADPGGSSTHAGCHTTIRSPPHYGPHLSRHSEAPCHTRTQQRTAAPLRTEPLHSSLFTRAQAHRRTHTHTAPASRPAPPTPHSFSEFRWSAGDASRTRRAAEAWPRIASMACE